MFGLVSVGMLVALAVSVPLAVGLGVGLGLAIGAAAAAAVVRGRLEREHASVVASEARYRRLVEHAPDVVLVHDPDGSGLWTNRAGQAALSLATPSPSLSLLDAVAVADRATLRTHLTKAATAGRARADVRVSGPSGAPVLLDLVSETIEVDGRRRVLSVGRDVGERRARERALAEARDHAEEAARVRSQYLASLSHEIRTPLTSVVGFTEILREEVDEAQRGLVDAIAAGGQRLLATLDSVLDLATLDARRETLRPASLDVVDAVEAAVAPLRHYAEDKGVALDVEPAYDEIPATLDANALGRVLAHLVGNGVRYTEKGGVTVEIDADAKDVSVRVIDTGIGIPEDAQRTLFQGFERPGGGFGLAISERLVRLMGGTISVESRWRSGTAVTVVLPRGETARPAEVQDLEEIEA
ncbi:sensor histidine kinase [Rubrivirga marina]|uniref:histidine kinase n=1 Tax=Rubrivirga marina TaxID=1196024 RepID=A0A271IYN3_9BACT|nr:ATP-binding protein [Rubrivirga marina]PAP75805.1 hypothetical protein BSZ37_04785 [Rubrivirga marina]